MRRASITVLFSVVVLASLACRSTWPVKIDDPAERFDVLDGWYREVVRDNETGLVWERRPLPPDAGPWPTAAMPWAEAVFYCYRQTWGNPSDNNGLDGRAGWRLPAIEELTSLLRGDFEADWDFIGLIKSNWGFDLSPPRSTDSPSRDNPRTYWSITTDPADEDQALVFEWVSRSLGEAAENYFFEVSRWPKAERALPWCVRGGLGHDPNPGGR